MRKIANRGHRIPLVGLWPPVLALLGFAAVLWLLRENDYRAVFRTVTALGSGLAFVVVVRGVIVLTHGLAWWRLLLDLSPVRLRYALGFRAVGEAINVMLPVAAVGGDVARAILLKSRGVPGDAAAASTLVDLLLQATAQALLVLIGVGLLLQVAHSAVLASWAEKGLGVAALALGGFYAAQRFGGAGIVDRVLNALARRWPTTAGGNAIRLEESLGAIYADRRAMAASFLLHEVAWMTGAFETWIALQLMSMPVSATTALILESLSRGLRAAAFPVPNGLGVQEGALIAVGVLFGIPPETALALSLVKRVPDFVIGVPGLLAAWHYLQN